MREEKEEPGDEGEEEDDKGESDGLGVRVGVVSCRLLAEAAQMGRERDLVRVKNKGERKKIKNKGKNKKNKKKEKKM